MKLEIVFDQNQTLVRLEGAPGPVQLEKIDAAQAPESPSNPAPEPKSMLRKVDLKFKKPVPESTIEKVFAAIKNGSETPEAIAKKSGLTTGSAYHYLAELIKEHRIEHASKGHYKIGWTPQTEPEADDQERD